MQTIQDALDVYKRQVICLLKDARSVISDGKTTFVNTSGTSAMAKGGSGDVLTGVIAALTASGVDPLHAAAYGAYLHGKAGEQAAEEKEMCIRDSKRR